MIKEGELYTNQILPKGWITKTNGSCKEIIVRDPDFLNEDGLYVKRIKKTTNFTPKKKRRK